MSLVFNENVQIILLSAKQHEQLDQMDDEVLNGFVKQVLLQSGVSCKLVGCLYQKWSDALHLVHVWYDSALRLVNLVKRITQNQPKKFEGFGLNCVQLLVQLLDARQAEHRAFVSYAQAEDTEHDRRVSVRTSEVDEAKVALSFESFEHSCMQVDPGGYDLQLPGDLDRNRTVNADVRILFELLD